MAATTSVELIEPDSSPARRPRWWPEALVIVWLSWVYDWIANLTPLRPVAPYDHARSVLHIEQVLHIDPEAAMDHWLAGHHVLALWLGNYYDNAHFVVTLGMIGWLWWRHPQLYRPLRTNLVLANVIAFVVFWRYPTAPPRLLNPRVYIDVVAASHAFGSWHSGTLATAADELAAMPSLHVAWAAWSALAFWRIFRRQRWAVLAWLYPLLTSVVVLATGNHFVLDVLAGFATLAVSTVIADRWPAWWSMRRPAWWPARRASRRGALTCRKLRRTAPRPTTARPPG